MSPTLTVWRFLHVEVDSMGPVAGNFVEGHITALDTGDSATATLAVVDISLDDGSLHLNSSVVRNGRFERGALTIAGTHAIEEIDGNGSFFFRRTAGMNLCAQPLPFEAESAPPGGGPPASLTGTITRIHTGGRTLRLSIAAGALTGDFIGGTVRIGGGAEMSIAGVSPANPPASPSDEVIVNALRVPFRAVDDDSPEGTDIPRPDTSGLEPAFRPAYVLPVHVAEGEQNDLVFIAHMETRGPGDILTAVRNGWAFDHGALDGNPLFWVVYIRGSFQDSAAIDDNDPDGQGVTWGIVDMVNPLVDRGRGANIYMEVLRAEELSLYPWIEPRNVVVHEIGHLFHAVHADGGVMSSGASGGLSDFTPVTIDRIRSIDYP